MLSQKYSYELCLRNSERVYWRVDDILGKQSFDFTKNFLPESLASSAALDFLRPDEQRKLNQIRGYTYAHLFRFIEEFIIAQIVSQAEAHRLGDEFALRALLRFAEEDLSRIDTLSSSLV